MACIETSLQGARASLSELVAGEGQDFAGSDALIAVRGNHVLYFSTNLHERRIHDHMLWLLEKAQQVDPGTLLYFDRPASVRSMEQIRERGVRDIQLRFGVHPATQQWLDRRFGEAGGLRGALSSSLGEVISRFVLEDTTHGVIRNHESFSAELILRPDRSKGNVFRADAKERVADMVEHILRPDDLDDVPDFVIHISGGGTVTKDQMEISSRRNVLSYANTISQHDGWNHLVAFYDECLKAGILAE